MEKRGLLGHFWETPQNMDDVYAKNKVWTCAYCGKTYPFVCVGVAPQPTADLPCERELKE